MSGSGRKVIFLGVDWGTHSSKWACMSAGSDASASQIFSSDLYADEGKLTFSPRSDSGQDDRMVRSLKDLLIHDPLGSSFWDAKREDTDTSLGEAVAFSLVNLLVDANNKIADSASNTLQQEIEIGFSFPNWLVDPSRRCRAAATKFTEAVGVAVHLFSCHSPALLPHPRRPFSIRIWKELIREARSQENSEAYCDLDIENMTQIRFGSESGGLRWCFLTESGAAGLPYLRAAKIELIPGAPGLAKLLVIDVGAGSTDVGYMFRVQNRKSHHEGLYYFPPASSFPVAGNALTKAIMKHYAARGEPLTYREAEARKLQQTGWHDLPFVKTWRDRIGEHVREYAEGVQDHRWLPLPVTLNVVLTGGSGLVPGLKDQIGGAVREAFERRGFPSRVVEKVRILGSHIPTLSFRTEAEYARRAVCLGAADSDKPSCKYMDKMDAPTQLTVVPNPRWV